MNKALLRRLMTLAIVLLLPTGRIVIAAGGAATSVTDPARRRCLIQATSRRAYNYDIRVRVERLYSWLGSPLLSHCVGGG